MTSTRPTSFGVWLFPDAAASTTVAAIEAAERLGLDEVWLGDEGPARDPFAILAAATQVTSRIRLGIAITNPYLRHPASTAAAAVTLQELAGGRFTLGFGTGGAMALGPVGLTANEPLRRVRDAVRITRAVATQTATDGYEPPEHAVPATPLPVVIGARGERLNRLASEVADGAFLGGVPLRAFPTVIGWARSVHPIPLVLSVATAFDEATFEQLRPLLLWTLADAPPLMRALVGVEDRDVEIAVHALARGDDGPARRVIDDRVAAELSVHGASQAIAGRLDQLVIDHRPDSLVLNLHSSGDPVAAVETAAHVLATIGTSLVHP